MNLNRRQILNGILGAAFSPSSVVKTFTMPVAGYSLPVDANQIIRGLTEHKRLLSAFFQNAGLFVTGCENVTSDYMDSLAQHVLASHLKLETSDFSRVKAILDRVSSEYEQASEGCEYDTHVADEYEVIFMQSLMEIGFTAEGFEELKKFFISVDGIRLPFYREVFRAIQPNLNDEELESHALNELYSTNNFDGGFMFSMPNLFEGHRGDIQKVLECLVQQKKLMPAIIQKSVKRFEHMKRLEQEHADQVQEGIELNHLSQHYLSWPFDFYDDDYPCPNP